MEMTQMNIILWYLSLCCIMIYMFYRKSHPVFKSAQQQKEITELHKSGYKIN